MRWVPSAKLERGDVIMVKFRGRFKRQMIFQGFSNGYTMRCQEFGEKVIKYIPVRRYQGLCERQGRGIN